MNRKTDWAVLEPRVCEFCGKEYYHRERTEKAFQFKKRRFCSNACKMQFLRHHNKGKRLKLNNYRMGSLNAYYRWCRYCGALGIRIRTEIRRNSQGPPAGGDEAGRDVLI
jgi:ribosomal protein L28